MAIVAILVAPPLSMNCVKWRTSMLVSDSVLPRLHHWLSSTLDYPPSGTEPFRLPLLVSGTVYPSTSLLHLRCLSSGHVSRLISSPFPIPVRDLVQCSRSDTCHFGHFNRSCYLLTYLLRVLRGHDYMYVVLRPPEMNAYKATMWTSQKFGGLR